MTAECAGVSGWEGLAKHICDEPCRWGGVSATRKYSKSELGRMWHCNRTVGSEGDKCWQHRTPSSNGSGE